MSRMDEKVMHVSCDVVEKDAAGLNVVVSRSNKGGSCAIAAQSGVTNAGNAEGLADTCSTPDEGRAEGTVVDWTTLTILPNENCDGEANAVANEDQIYEAFGFKEADEAPADEVPIPNIPADVEAEMNEAAIPVNDDIHDEC